MPRKRVLEEWPLDCTDTLGVKNFTEICVTLSQINVHLHITQEFKMAVENDWKMIFRNSLHSTL